MNNYMRKRRFDDEGNPINGYEPPILPADGDVKNTESYEDDSVTDSQVKYTDVSSDPMLNADVFKNRAMMAWWSLYMMIGLTVGVFVFIFIILGLFMSSPEVMSKLTNDYKVYLDWSSSFIGWGFSAFATVILAYMGVAAVFYNSYMKNFPGKKK